MRTWGQLRSLLVQKVPGLSISLANSYLQDAYSVILDRRKWSGLSTTGIVTFAAAYRTGSTAVVEGSTGVVGTGTSWTTYMVGRRFRLVGQREYYTIVDVPSSTSLTLDRPMTGPTATGVGYTIWQHEAILPGAVKIVNKVTVLSNNVDLEPKTLAELDELAPGRPTVGIPNFYVAEEYTVSGMPYKRLEIYPAPSSAVTLQYRVTAAAASFTGNNTDSSPLPWVSDAAILSYAESQAQPAGSAESARAVDQFNIHMKGMEATENSRIAPQPLKLDNRYTRHRAERAFR